VSLGAGAARKGTGTGRATGSGRELRPTPGPADPTGLRPHHT